MIDYGAEGQIQDDHVSSLRREGLLLSLRQVLLRTQPIITAQRERPSARKHASPDETHLQL